MSYEAAIAWSILRSLLAGGLCWGLARRTGPLARPDGPKGPSYFLLLAPFFMPGLVVGYAYRNASLSLVQTPLLNELLYLAIVVAQLTPVVVLALEWLPEPAMGPSGVFLWGLAERSGRRVPLSERVRALLAGELPRQLTAGALAALLCFQEVEVATLMQARGWAEWIFTKQAGGVELAEVWRFLVLPVGYGMLLTVPVLAYWMSERQRIHHGGREARSSFVRRAARRRLPVGRPFQAVPSERITHEWPNEVDREVGLRSGTGRNARPTGIVFLAARLSGKALAASWLLVVIWPVMSLAIGAFRGAGVMRLQAAIWQEIGDALVLAVTVTFCLWGVMQAMEWLNRSRIPSPPSGPPLPSGEGLGVRAERQDDVRNRFSLLNHLLFLPLLLPGLLGSLALGLLIFEICQRIGLQPSYSPVPLVVAMVLFLLPRALAMRAMLLRSEGQSGLYLAKGMVDHWGESSSLQPTLTPSPGGTVEVSGMGVSPMRSPRDSRAGRPCHGRGGPEGETSDQRGGWGRAIVWRLQGEGRFWAMALLFWWAYLELTLPSLLRPAGMAPAPMRLYNFLHYGHIPGLAAMLVVVLAVPLVLMGMMGVVMGRKSETRNPKPNRLGLLLSPKANP